MPESALPEASLRVALEVFRADRAVGDTSMRALSAATGMSIGEIAIAMEPLIHAELVVPIPPRSSAPVSVTDWLSFREGLAFEMMPMLPTALEGHLDYSPADDDERVEREIGHDAPASVDVNRIAAYLGVPVGRVRESLTRVERRRVRQGMRLRMVMEVTFPEAEPETFMDVLRRWGESVARADGVPCTDVHIREVVSIPFASDGHEYDDWRNRRGVYASSA